jgi:hypothetical protein
MKMKDVKEVGFKDSTKMVDVKLAKDGGLMEATAKLKAKGMKDGGMVVKDKINSFQSALSHTPDWDSRMAVQTAITV